jgi:hypothetical protein
VSHSPRRHRTNARCRRLATNTKHKSARAIISMRSEWRRMRPSKATTLIPSSQGHTRYGMPPLF